MNYLIIEGGGSHPRPRSTIPIIHKWQPLPVILIPLMKTHKKCSILAINMLNQLSRLGEKVFLKHIRVLTFIQ